MRERITLVGGPLAAAARDDGRSWAVMAEAPVPAPPSDRPSPSGRSGPGGVRASGAALVLVLV
ncbi:hypothetical protein [Streptomyces fragilis]|uniref:Uncharacterized protein n=1 Tax=Streptomyces fragilis TaxID=67301 RepID=A0ABV2YFZ8_9ACTN|nr:hypothetical protein [Streptomyces fragilis]